MAGVELHRIYVAVLGKTGERWQPVDAVYEGEDSYRIVSENPNLQAHWEYGTGERVRCRSLALPGGERVLVATERLHPESFLRSDPEADVPP